MSDSQMERTRLLPTRRRLLKSAALAAGPYALLPAPRVGAQPRSLDYPLATWEPATTANYTASGPPEIRVPDLVVIHVTQASYANTLAVFQHPQKKVSAHYVVRSGDGHVAQCVREHDVAWHAGDLPITPIPVRTGTGRATYVSSTPPEPTGGAVVRSTLSKRLSVPLPRVTMSPAASLSGRPS